MLWLLEATASISGGGVRAHVCLLARPLWRGLDDPSRAYSNRRGAASEPRDIEPPHLLVAPTDTTRTPRDQAVFAPAPEFHRRGNTIQGARTVGTI